MNAAESKVNHSAVSSSVLCCRPLLLLVFLPLPPPLVGSGFWWAVVNKQAQLIANADFYPCGKLAFFKEKIFSFFFFFFLHGCICSLTQGLAVSELDISWLWWWGSLLITVTSTPTGWSEGQRSSSILYVSRGIAGGNENSTFFDRYICNYACVPISPRFLSAISQCLRWKLCVFTANGQRRCLLGSWTPRVEDRNGETFLQAGILWLENHLVCAAEYDMETQAKYEDNEL